MQFKWMNESRLTECENRLELYAPAHTDFFYSSESAGEEGITPESLCNAPYYYTELKKDRSAARYLKENLSHANFLIKALRQRATTILRVAEEIVLRQYHFFEQGIDHLRPMTLKDVAGALSLSESTVSRITAGKYLAAPNGLFELKYFFSAAAGSYIGEDASTTVVKHKIKTLIDAEAPAHILSDDKIVELLEHDGIKIARRTVAKYRDALGIPTSGSRKRAKRLQPLAVR